MTEPNLLGHAHFLVGCLAVVAGFAAFSSKKGQNIHRKAGTVFVVSMALLTASGLWLSISRNILFTIFLSAIAFHTFFTGWAAAATNKRVCRLVTKLSPVVSGTLMVGAGYGGILAANAPGGVLNDLPPGAFYTIAVIAFLIFVFDVSFIRTAYPSERRRITRHLWRMGFSFFLAAGIFFFGNNHVLPEVLRTPVFLSTPVIVMVFATMYFAIKTRLSKPIGK